jgi:hypothetical protein
MKSKSDVYFGRSSGVFVGLNADLREELHRKYPLIALEKEFARMTSWLLSPKGKSRKDTIGFIINWLNNATPSPSDAPKDAPNEEISNMLNFYLEELWKAHPHLYMFNRLVT